MKPAKNVEYLRPIQLAKLSDTERAQYRDDVMDLRKKLRALVAYQDSSDAIFGENKYTINSILKNYALADSRAEVSAKIMRVFFGDKYYFERIRPIYEEKAVYDNASQSYRDTHPKVYSPVDYFDIPTLYHYYKFRQTILDKHRDNVLGKVKYVRNSYGFNDLITDAYNEYFGRSGPSNMYYRSADIRVVDDPVKGYVNMGNLQANFEKEIDKDFTLTEEEADSFRTINVLDVIKGDVNRYMMSYVRETSVLANKDQAMDDLVYTYSKRAVASIKKRCYVKKAEDYLIERHRYGLTDNDVYRIIPRSNQQAKALSQDGQSDAMPSKDDDVKGIQLSLFDIK